MKLHKKRRGKEEKNDWLSSSLALSQQLVITATTLKKLRQRDWYSWTHDHHVLDIVIAQIFPIIIKRYLDRLKARDHCPMLGEYSKSRDPMKFFQVYVSTDFTKSSHLSVLKDKDLDLPGLLIVPLSHIGKSLKTVHCLPMVADSGALVSSKNSCMIIGEWVHLYTEWHGTHRCLQECQKGRMKWFAYLTNNLLSLTRSSYFMYIPFPCTRRP